MTTLTITPDIAKKKLKLAGTVASGEKVAVTIAGFGTVATENLRLRVMAGDIPVGYFPLENEDAWTVSGADLTCTLNLATWQAERHCKFGAEVCFILEDTGTPQLYGVGDFSLRPWIKLSGVDVPKNLDNYKVRMDALLAEINRVEGVANGKYTKPETGIPKTDLAPSVRTSLDKADAVTLKVSKSAFDALLGLSLPDSATQKDTRQIVQKILMALQNAATCIALMFALPVFGIDGTTAWEDVPPDRTVKSVVEQFSPPADFSTNNQELVETIKAKVQDTDLSEVFGAFAATGTVYRADETWRLTDGTNTISANLVYNKYEGYSDEWNISATTEDGTPVDPSLISRLTVEWVDAYIPGDFYWTIRLDGGASASSTVDSDYNLTNINTERIEYYDLYNGTLTILYVSATRRKKLVSTRLALTNDIPSGATAPLPRYLHALDFADSYHDAAAEYYASRGSGEAGGCSAVRSGGFLYRNFDYPFDDRAEFVVRMSAGQNRFASVGVAQVGTNLTERTVTSGRPSRWYKALPGATVDGINENGVVAEINVVDTPVAGWRTNATEGAIHPLAAVRWALDNATDARTAAEYIAANIRFPSGWTQNFHYMVADAENTYVVENGTATDGDEYHEPDEPVAMTNFQLSKFPWDGMGKERFNLLLGGAGITNAWYTKAYRRGTAPPWTSDLADVIGYTNEIFDAWSTHPKEYFRGRTTNGQPWWQTVHTSVYDISNRTLRVAVQETDDWHTFQVPTSGGGVDEGVIRGIVGQFAATGTVSRASSVGTAEQWTDANGCVWRFYSNWTLVSDDYGHSYNYPIWSDSTPYGSGGWYLTLDDVAPYFDLTHGKNSNIVSFNINTSKDMIFLRGTNLVGRVALTNDVMSRAETEARFASVDRPYSMIYDPVAGRALTADGRLVDYGRAPRIAGHFVLTPDADASSSGFTDGFMPTLALLGGRTNLVEGVDWTSAVTPSSPDGSGGYYVSTADIAWSQTNTGYYTVGVLPVSVQIVKTVSSFGTSCTLSLGGVVSPYYVVDVPGVGTGEVSIYGSDIAGDTVILYWSFYDYTYWTSYYGSDVFRLRFVDEGGDGVQAVAFGNRGRFATLSDMQSQVEEAIDDRVGSMDSVRSLEIMRNDGPLELGSGPGILKWDFVTDDREWILTVPNLSAAMRVYTSYSGTTEYTGYPYDSYTVPEIRERTFVRSFGNAGNGRCLASQWHVVGAIGDAEFIVDAIVSNGVVRVLSNVQEPPIYGMSIGDPDYPSASFSTYSSLNLSGDGTSSVRFYRGTLVSGGPSESSTTRWPTLHLTTASGSYTVVTGAYMRALGPETKDLHWDPGLRRTWRVGVSNGCFFAEIVSTNNLLYTVTHQ